jgi:hypothetical protein
VVALVQVRVADEDRRIERRGRRIDGLADCGECKRIAIDGTLAPERDINRTINDLR